MEANEGYGAVCLNCSYFYVETDESFCRIDKEIIKLGLAYIKFCKAFDLWWGAVEF